MLMQKSKVTPNNQLTINLKGYNQVWFRVKYLLNQSQPSIYLPTY